MLYSYFFIGIPAIAVMFFVVSLILYCSAKGKNKKNPGSVGTQRIKTYLVLLILSSVIMGILLSIVIGFVVLISLSIAFM